MNLKSYIAAPFAVLLAVSPAGSGSMPLMGAGKPTVVAGGSLVLDGVSGVRAAFSTRQLLTAYAGNALQVQRTSDNATSNIGFSAGVLDTTTLGTFCSATTCKVITWYDQSGNGRDHTQGTIANAPTIYTGGAVQAINTKPAILFASASSTVLTNATMNSNGGGTEAQLVNTVATFQAATIQGIFGPVGAAAFLFRTGASNDTQLVKSGVINIGGSSGAYTAATGGVIEAIYDFSNGNYTFWFDAAAGGTSTNLQGMSSSGGTYIGADAGPATFLNGKMGELIIISTTSPGPSSGVRTAIEANQKTYWGTP